MKSMLGRVFTKMSSRILFALICFLLCQSGSFVQSHATLDIRGVTVKVDKFVHFLQECTQSGSEQCQQYFRTLCNSTRRILREHPDIELDTSECTVSGKQGQSDSVKLKLKNPPRTFDGAFIQMVIPPFYAGPSYKGVTFGWISKIIGSGIKDTGYGLYDDRRKRLELSAVTMWNGRIVSFRNLCRNPNDLECVLFKNRLCNRTGEALNNHQEFDRLYSTCFVTGSTESSYVKIIVYLSKHGRYSWTDYNKLKLVVATNTFTTMRDTPSVGVVIGVSGVGIRSNDWGLVDPRREKIIITGTARINRTQVYYQSECGFAQYEAKCFHFMNSLCKGIDDALRYTHPMTFVYSACYVHDKGGSSVIVTVLTRPGSHRAPGDIIKKAILGRTYPNGWAHFSAITSIKGEKIVIVNSN